jgi:hypothetical protein
MIRSSRHVPGLLAAVLAAVALAAAMLAGPAAAVTLVSPPPTLRLDGIGPLRLGMGARAALGTGWLAHRGRGCELGGPPVPVTYRLNGPAAPRGVAGFAEFRSGRLRTLSFTGGVRTGAGVVPGTTAQREMVARYRRAGFTVRTQFLDTFGGTFVTVRRGGRQVLGGFAEGGVVRTLGIPSVPVCE